VTIESVRQIDVGGDVRSRTVDDLEHALARCFRISPPMISSHAAVSHVADCQEDRDASVSRGTSKLQGPRLFARY
jgi:hypothetical protein